MDLLWWFSHGKSSTRCLETPKCRGRNQTQKHQTWDYVQYQYQPSQNNPLISGILFLPLINYHLTPLMRTEQIFEKKIFEKKKASASKEKRSLRLANTSKRSFITRSFSVHGRLRVDFMFMSRGAILRCPMPLEKVSRIGHVCVLKHYSKGAWDNDTNFRKWLFIFIKLENRAGSCALLAPQISKFIAEYLSHYI